MKAMFMSITRTHEFRLQSATIFSLQNHSTLKFVFDIMPCESTDLITHLLLNDNDQHFHCIIHWFTIMLETDECDSWFSTMEPTTYSTNLITKMFNEFSAWACDRQNSLVIMLYRLILTDLPWIYFYKNCTCGRVEH